MIECGTYPDAIHAELTEDEIVRLQILALEHGERELSKKLRVAQMAAFTRWHG